MFKRTMLWVAVATTVGFVVAELAPGPIAVAKADPLAAFHYHGGRAGYEGERSMMRALDYLESAYTTRHGHQQSDFIYAAIREVNSARGLIACPLAQRELALASNDLSRFLAFRDTRLLFEAGDHIQAALGHGRTYYQRHHNRRPVVVAPAPIGPPMIGRPVPPRPFPPAPPVIGRPVPLPTPVPVPVNRGSIGFGTDRWGVNINF